MEYYLSLYEKAMPDSLPLKDKILASIEMGFDSCEICIDTNEIRQQRLNWTKNEFADFKDFLSEHQLSIYSISLSALRDSPLGNLDSNLNALAFERLEKGLNFAHQVGARVMLVNAYDVYGEESTVATQQQFARNIQRAAEIAKSYQIIIGLENAEMPFGDTLAKVVRWIREVNSPWLQCYFDPANSYNALEGQTNLVQQDFLIGADYVKAVHIKDSLPGEYRMTPYGEGQVDFSKIIPLLVDNGQQYFTAELFMLSEDNWRQYAQWVNHYLRRFLDKAF